MIKVNQRVNKLDENDNGVAVFTTDGKSYDGDIDVACDGVNSFVRDHSTYRLGA